MMNPLTQIKSLLKQFSKKPLKEAKTIFYKTGPGEYAEHDRFIGVNVPTLRKISKNFSALTLKEIQTLIQSKMNEERLLALFILVHQYQKSENSIKNILYQFYLDNLQHINNWNLVDASAHLILGAHLMNTNRRILLRLAKSENIWERRVAIVSTWYFIRKQDLEWTFKVAVLLLEDKHDLIHKATGWMLREAGKKDEKQLIAFLEQHAKKMPRTMLRYAIEKFPEPQRKNYLGSAYI
jgi:3-methyladenine DNA glycosylase AlkD